MKYHEYCREVEDHVFIDTTVYIYYMYSPQVRFCRGGRDA